MKVDIPTKNMVQRMVDTTLRREMKTVYKMINKLRKELLTLQEKGK